MKKVVSVRDLSVSIVPKIRRIKRTVHSCDSGFELAFVFTYRKGDRDLAIGPDVSEMISENPDLLNVFKWRDFPVLEDSHVFVARLVQASSHQDRLWVARFGLSVTDILNEDKFNNPNYHILFHVRRIVALQAEAKLMLQNVFSEVPSDLGVIP